MPLKRRFVDTARPAHMKTACAFGVLLWTTLLAANLAGQDTAGVGSISGAVRDSDDQPVSGVRTCILTTSRCAVSDDRGAFRLSEVRPGNYRMEITIPGQSATLSANVEARAGLDASLDISLPKLGGSRAALRSDSLARGPFWKAQLRRTRGHG
jgi:hypothetical protein